MTHPSCRAAMLAILLSSCESSTWNSCDKLDCPSTGIFLTVLVDDEYTVPDSISMETAEDGLMELNPELDCSRSGCTLPYAAECTVTVTVGGLSDTLDCADLEFETTDTVCCGENISANTTLSLESGTDTGD